MIDCLAYRIKELAFGGLALSTRTRLRKIAADIRDGKQIALLTERRIKPGTRLVREWGQETHTVETTENGFAYRGPLYANLSQVAGVITGSKWSGPLFFGLRKRPKAADEGERMPHDAPRILRCEIYTRKSSEEGLEQSFNSLDAQREACSAFILSQRHEGGKEVATRYDDGGFSGGNMERPAFAALMKDTGLPSISRTPWLTR